MLAQDIVSGRVLTTKADDELLTYREAAALLGITPSTLQTWTCTRRYDVPFLKIGRCVRFRRSALERWLHRRERGGKAER